jgi:hypothetical protein
MYVPVWQAQMLKIRPFQSVSNKKFGLSSVTFGADYSCSFHCDDDNDNDELMKFLPSSCKPNPFGERVLWYCTDPQYVCDGIIMPADDDKVSPIIVYDTSVMTSKDLKPEKLKGLKQFQAYLKETFPGRRVVVVLCYHESLAPQSSSNNTEETFTDFYTLDRDELAKIKVQF